MTMILKKFSRALIAASVFISMLVAGGHACAAGDIADVIVKSASSSSQNNVGVSFGHVFGRGEVVNPSAIGARLPEGTQLPLQVDVKARHADGSLRHAVLTTILPSLAGNSSKTVTLYTPGSTASVQSSTPCRTAAWTLSGWSNNPGVGEGK